MIEQNAIITKAILEIEEPGFLSCWLTLDKGGTSQGFGGYVLFKEGVYDKDSKNHAGVFIWEILKIAGVERWEDLAGKTIRVRYKTDSWSETIHSIGHIVKDIWFCPKEVFGD